jgi:hypothetical protein
MRFYAEGSIAKADQELFKRIEKSIHSLSNNLDLGKDEIGSRIELSCHILARAVALIFSLRYVDGKHLDLIEHSWVETSSGNIIDVYPVGALGGPQLIDASSTFIFKKREYIALSKKNWRARYGEMDNSPSFHRAIDMVAEKLQQGLGRSS